MIQTEEQPKKNEIIKNNMNMESTKDNNSTNPAITYSECYVQFFFNF